MKFRTRRRSAWPSATRMSSTNMARPRVVERSYCSRSSISATPRPSSPTRTIFMRPSCCPRGTRSLAARPLRCFRAGPGLRHRIDHVLALPPLHLEDLRVGHVQAGLGHGVAARVGLEDRRLSPLLLLLAPLPPEGREGAFSAGR